MRLTLKSTDTGVCRKKKKINNRGIIIIPTYRKKGHEQVYCIKIGNWELVSILNTSITFRFYRVYLKTENLCFSTIISQPFWFLPQKEKYHRKIQLLDNLVGNIKRCTKIVSKKVFLLKNFNHKISKLNDIRFIARNYHT